jgi:hypothetical protein
MRTLLVAAIMLPVVTSAQQPVAIGKADKEFSEPFTLVTAGGPGVLRGSVSCYCNSDRVRCTLAELYSTETRWRHECPTKRNKPKSSRSNKRR